MTHQTEKIIVKIFPDGQIQAEISGFEGKKCVDYITVLEQLLDAQVVDSTPTAEYFSESHIDLEQKKHSPLLNKER